MIEVRLKSEFKETRPAENPNDPPVPTTEYIEREAAFEDFNRYVDKDPSLTAEVMGYLALGATIRPEHEAIAKAGERVLDKSNNGTQIGFEGKRWDEIWGVIFADPGHKKAASAYHAERRKEGEHSPAVELLCRKRGAHVLRVYASERIQEQAIALPMSSQAEAA